MCVNNYCQIVEHVMNDLSSNVDKFKSSQFFNYNSMNQMTIKSTESRLYRISIDIYLKFKIDI